MVILEEPLINQITSFYSSEDFMSKDFISVTPNDLASECLRIMAEKKIGCLAVMQDKELVGIINQKDLVKLGI